MIDFFVDKWNNKWWQGQELTRSYCVCVYTQTFDYSLQIEIDELSDRNKFYVIRIRVMGLFSALDG